MWWSVRAAASAAVLGAALVAASVHGSGHGLAGGVALSTTSTYKPPAVAASVASPARQVRVLARPAAPRPAHPTRRPTSRPKHAVEPVHHAASRPVVRRVATTPYAAALASAVARIPTYRDGTVRWVISRAYAFWGTADWYHAVLYVSPDVPRDKLYDVAVHEWSHELSVLDYAGDVAAATTAMNNWFGGSGLTGPERAADCMSILQGATWTHYTTCTDAHWRAGARLLIAGQRL